jgi:hypothetical protein
MDPIKAVPTALHHFMMSDADRARALEVQAIRRRHAEDDAARKSGGITRVIAITSYMVFDGTDPRGRVIQAGTEFDMPTFDVEEHTGKVVPADQFRPQG